MLNFMKRIFIMLVGVLFVLAPVAQASVVAVPSCGPMMMKAGPMSCCGSSCDCKVETQKTDLSFALPTVSPRFELSLPSFYTGSLMIDAVSTEIGPRTAEESPPSKEPLYQVYSDYRL